MSPHSFPVFHPARSLLVLLALLLTAAGVWAGACRQCGNELGRRYLTSNNQTFCSRTCYLASRPTCITCQEPLVGKYLVANEGGYCSEDCFKQSLPPCAICGERNRNFASFHGKIYCNHHAESPRCNECQHPFKTGFRLDDGRHLCATCRPDAIFRMRDAQLWYDHARRELQGLSGFRIPEPPPLRLVDRHTLAELMSGAMYVDDTTVVRGCYLRTVQMQVSSRGQRRVTGVEEEIVMLFGQRRDNFCATAVHELTHDLLADNFPNLKDAPLWVEEGICQYVASIYCHTHQLTEALETIETSDNPIYGDGYRYFRRMLGANNWSGLLAWMRTADTRKLPAKPPEPAKQ